MCYLSDVLLIGSMFFFFFFWGGGSSENYLQSLLLRWYWVLVHGSSVLANTLKIFYYAQRSKSEIINSGPIWIFFLTIAADEEITHTDTSSGMLPSKDTTTLRLYGGIRSNVISGRRLKSSQSGPSWAWSTVKRRYYKSVGLEALGFFNTLRALAGKITNC